MPKFNSNFIQKRKKVEHYGWEYLADTANIRCFKYNPNMKSSLGFLRKTQWAREHIEDVYMDMLEED